MSFEELGRLIEEGDWSEDERQMREAFLRAFFEVTQEQLEKN